VIITGRAAGPGYLVVTEQGAELKAADDLRGRTTRDTVQALVAAEGTDADAIAIGPAGERRVRFAAMAHYWRNREGVSGRGGLRERRHDEGALPRPRHDVPQVSGRVRQAVRDRRG